jgi:hypothetical protein
MGSRLESKPAKHLTHSLARPRADVIKQVAGSATFSHLLDARYDRFSTHRLGNLGRIIDRAY